MPSYTFNFELIKRMASQLTAIALAIIILDLIFAIFLIWLEGWKPNNAISAYVNYGRSVQGKQIRWESHPQLVGNLSKVAWRDDIIKRSSTAYLKDQDAEFTIRSYGMSFANNILNSAKQLDQTIKIDLHSGPAAPPNFVYSILMQDQDNRNSGDTVVFSILSSSVKAMGSFTNATWNFEQPAPFTYPVYFVDKDSSLLTRIPPKVTTYEEHLISLSAGSSRDLWLDQLAQTDHMWNWKAYSIPLLDHSPFFNFIRRMVVSRSQNNISNETLRTNSDHYFEALKRMLSATQSALNSECQNLVVFLIQSADPSDPELEEELLPFLTNNNIKFLSTQRMASSSEPSNYIADGHFTPEVDSVFAQFFLRELSTDSSLNSQCER